MRLPAEPLATHLKHLVSIERRCGEVDEANNATGGWDTLGRKYGISGRTLERIANQYQMLNGETADRVSIAVGLHPAILWPEWLDRGPE